MPDARILINDQEKKLLQFLSTQKDKNTISTEEYNRLLNLARQPLGVKNIINTIIQASDFKNGFVDIIQKNFPRFNKNTEKLNGEFLLLLKNCKASYADDSDEEINRQIKLCDQQIERLKNEIQDEVQKLGRSTLKEIYALNTLGFSLGNADNVYAFLLNQFGNDPIRTDEPGIKKLNEKLQPHSKLIDALNKYQVFHQAKAKLKETIQEPQKNVAEIKLYNYRLHLKNHEPVLLKRRDNIIESFFKAAGLAVVSIFTLGVAAYPAYQRLFGQHSTDSSKVLDAALNTRKNSHSR